MNKVIIKKIPNTKKNKFNQLCVWAGVTVGKENIKDFEDHFKVNFNFRVKYAEEVKTKPDIKDGKVVDGTGGRNDIFFYIHNDDINKFAVQRFRLGHIRWWEDVVSYNDNSHLYTQKILDKYKVNW